MGGGGGVGMYIRNGLNFRERRDLESYKLRTFENLVIEVLYPGKSYILSNIYRSPNPPPQLSASEHLDCFLETLDSHLAMLSETNCHSYLFLDSNINLLQLPNSTLCSNYLDTVITNGFLQIISKATRVQSNRPSLIDHILTNANLQSYNAGTIIDDLSNHYMNYIQLNHCKTWQQDNKECTRCMINETNINNLRHALRLTDWSGVKSDNNAETSFNTFWTTFKTLFDTHLPIKRIKFNKNKHKIHNYMTEDLLNARCIKLNLQKLAIKHKTQESHDKYIAYRNYYNTLVRQHKQKYFADNLNLNVKNSKRTWELLKEAANLNKSSVNVEKIVSNNGVLTDKIEIANEFNDFFTTIGVKISESVKETKIKPEDYMPLLENIQNLDLGTTSQVHVCDIIKSMRTKNSCDLEGISTKLLQKLHIELSWPLAHIFNLSLTTGVFPSKIKSSRTVPIFKSGRADLCDNYRPIALLSSLSKILEKMVSVQLVNHLDRNKILYKHQYGFQRNKSTEHSIIHALNFISQAMNDNKYTIGVFFDLKKAFDVCSHDILLMKLSRMGITGTALEWFKSYLSD